MNGMKHEVKVCMLRNILQRTVTAMGVVMWGSLCGVLLLKGDVDDFLFGIDTFWLLSASSVSNFLTFNYILLRIPFLLPIFFSHSANTPLLVHSFVFPWIVGIIFDMNIF
jgi:hypothetical protein